MPAIPGNVIIMLTEETVLCSHYAQLCKGFNLWPKDQATCYKFNTAD